MLSALSVPLLAGCRTPVAPRHGALRHHTPHTLAAPLVQHLLQTVGLPPEAVDTLILGNALGAGGNPARMTALAAALRHLLGGHAVLLGAGCNQPGSSAHPVGAV